MQAARRCETTGTRLGLGVPSQSGVRWAAETVASSRPPPAEVRALESAFRYAVAVAQADVGLLHDRADAYFYTTAVHEMDAGMHLYIGVSLWDPAVARALCGAVTHGHAQESVEASTIARRLELDPGRAFILGIPVLVSGSVAALIELGRRASPYPAGIERRLVEGIGLLVV